MCAIPKRLAACPRKNIACGAASRKGQGREMRAPDAVPCLRTTLGNILAMQEGHG
jgi:hypothetical protein